MALPKVNYGDVFEIKTSNGMGYFQLIKNATVDDCELIRVFRGTFDNEEDARIENLAATKEAYFIRFPLRYALKRKLVRYIGNYKVPDEVVIPRFFRSKDMVRGEFISWDIVDSETLKRKLFKELSDEQKKLSPFGVWNDTLLAERIASGWSLEDWV